MNVTSFSINFFNSCQKIAEWYQEYTNGVCYDSGLSKGRYSDSDCPKKTVTYINNIYKPELYTMRFQIPDTQNPESSKNQTNLCPKLK